jgi:hypothetical protein
MKKLIIAVIPIIFWGLGVTGVVNAANGWTKIKDSSGIKLYERSVSGTELKEFMAVTFMDAKMEVIGTALRDVPAFTKWLAACESVQILKQYDLNNYVMYIIQNPPLIERRDIITKNETLYDYEHGLAKVTFYTTDEMKIPVEKKRTRITVMNGFFQIECLGRDKAKFIYYLKVDPAGDIPRRVAYSVMKNYPFDSIKNLKKIVADSKYASLAKGSDDEKQMNTNSSSEVSVKRIFGATMMRLVKNKDAMQAILAADSEGIKKIASSGSAYENVQKTAKNMFNKYIDKIVADKKIAESLKNNQKMHDEITELLHTYTEADDDTVDSIVARYSR